MTTVDEVVKKRKLEVSVPLAKEYNENKLNTYFICQFKDEKIKPESCRLYNFRLYLNDPLSKDYFILVDREERLKDGYYLCKFFRANINYNTGGLVIKVKPVRYLFKEITNEIRSYKSWIFIYKSKYMFDRRDISINLTGYNEDNVFKYYNNEIYNNRLQDETNVDVITRMFIEGKLTLRKLHELLNIDIIDCIINEIISSYQKTKKFSYLNDYPITKRRLENIFRMSNNMIDKMTIRNYFVKMLITYRENKLYNIHPEVSKNYGIMEKIEEAGIYYLSKNKK